MIIEKEVGGPLWPICPLGIVILRLLLVLLPREYRIFQIMFEEMIMSF